MTFKSIRTLLLITFAAWPLSSAAKANDDGADVKADLGTFARPVKRTPPTYPGRALSRGQEGWVIVSFVVQTDGTIADPIVVDSSGVDAFERSAIRTVQKWSYEPATQNGKPVEQCQTKAKLTFALDTNQVRGASRKFIRRYDNAQQLIKGGDLDGAESLIDETMELGEWNLYEYSRLWLLKSLVAQGREDKRAQLNALYRTIGKKGDYVEKRMVKAVLPIMLQLELQLSEYSAAIETYEQMQKFSKLAEEHEELVASVNKLIAVVEGESVLSVPAELAPCPDCPGQWSYKPMRREFAFDNISGGELKDFELRCDWRRYRHRIDADLTWKIPKKWGECQLHVYGDVGATFNFVEYAETPGAQSGNTVISNADYVVDPVRLR